MSKTVKSASAPKNFESALSELESLVTEMESGSLSLEASLNAYKRGMELSVYCQKTLSETEAQVKILEGQLLKDFSPDQSSQDPDE